MYLFIALIVSLLINALQLYMHYREKEGIFNRYMSRDYDSYKYYKEEYPIDLKHKEEVLEKKREKEVSEEEQKRINIAKKF